MRCWGQTSFNDLIQLAAANQEEGAGRQKVFLIDLLKGLQGAINKSRESE